jgi:predicted NBD/HSP70 family sugar kinase
MAELWYDTGTDPPSSLVMVLVSEGVGVGMFVNDEIYRGANGTAGEFGHTVVVVNGKKCRCGNSGCWELYASDHATVARYFSRDSPPGLQEGDTVIETEPLSLSVLDLIKRARGGDEQARASLIEAGRYIGIGIGNIMAALNPLEIVIGGQIIEGWHLIEAPMQQSISRNIQHDLSKTIVRPTRLGNDSSLLSAVALAISRRFAFSRIARVTSSG